MLIGLVGDIHGDMWKMNQVVDDYRRRTGLNLDGLIQVGDFGFFKQIKLGSWHKIKSKKMKFNVPSLVVHGNHEDPHEWRGANGHNVPNLLVADKPIQLIKWMGMNILCVGGAHCVDNPPENYFVPHSDEVFHQAITFWFQENKPKIDLLLTHDAPMGCGIKPNPRFAMIENLNKEIGSKELLDLILTVSPTTHFNGHYHVWNSKMIGQTEHWALPVPFDQNYDNHGRDGYAVLNTETMEVEAVFSEK